MTTYYVSSGNGDDGNAGTSQSAPLATLQAAADLVKPGDTVEVMNGTYTGGGDVLDITTSGTASAPITFEAAPGQTPVINSSGSWNAINIEASYIVINGFTVVGDAANYTLAQALAGYSTGDPNLDGNGIAINPTGSTPVPNHIIIENNTVYNEPGGGIYTEGADYVQILNNVVHDNAHWSAFGNSGISVSTSANSDTTSGVHDTITGNISYNNTQLVPTIGGNTITDGEGIILDTNPGFVGVILVENNTTYGNSGPGIESFLTDNAVITGNRSYLNNTGNIQAASNAEIFINQSKNNTVTNNITTPPACYMRGTLIATPAGDVPIEELSIADPVLTLSGDAKPIKWIGRRTVSTLFADPLHVLPIRIKANALGNNVPSRDLLLSPDHALFIDGVLVHAGALVNASSIVRETDVPARFTYYHVELDDHALIVAENTPAESFIDNVDYVLFDNWQEYVTLYPQGRSIIEMPYPRAKAYRQVPRTIRERLAARAAVICNRGDLAA
jgi:parallel beta-helix repeat protein